MTEYDGADVLISAAAAKWDANIITRPTGRHWGKMTKRKRIQIGEGVTCLVYEVDETDEKADLLYETEEVRTRVTVDIRSKNEQTSLLIDKAFKKAISYVRSNLLPYYNIYLYAHIEQRLNHSNRQTGIYHFTRDYMLQRPHRDMENEP